MNHTKHHMQQTPERISEKKNAKKSDRIDETDLSDSWFSRSICSSNDCTGLIPALPSEEELEAYEEMYQFCLAHVPKETEE